MSIVENYDCVCFRVEDLEVIKKKLGMGDAVLASVYSMLLQGADAALLRPTTSVLDKTGVAASGNRQDFYAIGAYSWPDPETPDGLPYIRRDGVSNPEAYESGKYDKGRFSAMVNDVKTLALAYYYGDDEKYAAKAAMLLRSWFIDPVTRMNPNLRHAAVRPGVNDGLHSGIIEGVILIEMLDYVALLAASTGWSKEDDTAIRRWFLEFSDWLVSSNFGRREILSVNNHGSYYLAQVIAFASFGGNHRRAEKAVLFVKRQMARQFSADGSMPKEISRPNAFFYAIYGLRAFVILARLAERYGYDLWNYRSVPGQPAAIASSFYFLSPYLTGRREWSGARLDSGYSPYAIQICRMAGAAYGAKLLNEMVAFLASQPSAVTNYDSLIGFSCVGVKPDGDDVFRGVPDAAELVSEESFFTKVVRRFVKLLARSGLWPESRLY